MTGPLNSPRYDAKLLVSICSRPGASWRGVRLLEAPGFSPWGDVTVTTSYFLAATGARGAGLRGWPYLRHRPTEPDLGNASAGSRCSCMTWAFQGDAGMCRRPLGVCSERQGRREGESWRMATRETAAPLAARTAGAGAPLLDVRGVTMRFPAGRGRTGGAVTALADLSLVVARGEFVALVGPSGGGKSTLLSIIAGLETPA